MNRLGLRWGLGLLCLFLGLTVVILNVVAGSVLSDLVATIMRGKLPSILLLWAYEGIMPIVGYLILPLVCALTILLYYLRLAEDRNLLVLSAAGISTWRLALPGLALALAVTVGSLFLALHLAPSASTKLEDVKSVLRDRLGLKMLEAGRFNSLEKGRVTVHFRHWRGPDSVGGLFFHERLEDGRARVVTASRASFAQQPDRIGVRFLQGERQLFDKTGIRINSVRFDSYTRFVETAQSLFAPKRNWRGFTEMTVAELLDPPPHILADPVRRRSWRAEAHQRVFAPLLALGHAFLLLGLLLRWCTAERRWLPRMLLLAIGLTVVHVGALLLLMVGARTSYLALPAAYAVLGFETLLGVCLIARANGWRPGLQWLPLKPTLASVTGFARSRLASVAAYPATLAKCFAVWLVSVARSPAFPEAYGRSSSASRAEGLG